MVCHLHAVGGDGGHIEKPVLLSHLNGRTTVFFLNLLYFTFAFGKMYMNTHMILLCFLRYDPHKTVITGIRCMRSQHKSQPVTISGRISFLVSLLKPHLTCLIIATAYKSSADHGSHTGFLHSPCSHVNIHLHIVKAGGSALHHFDDSKAGTPVGVLIRHLLLDGINGSKQPVHKRQVIRHISHKCHIGVGMAIDETRDYKLIFAVYHLVRLKACRLLPHCSNLVTFNINTGLFNLVFFLPRKNGKNVL